MSARRALLASTCGEVFDGPAVASGLAHAFRAVSTLSKAYRLDLRARFGGRTLFEPSAPAPRSAAGGTEAGETPSRPGWGFYL